MKKKNFAFITILLVFSAMFVNAQNNEINRVEVFGGYSVKRADPGFASEDIGTDFDTAFGKKQTAHGFNASITGNVSKYFGLKFDVSSHGKTFDTTFQGDQYNTKYSIQNFLGGFQVKNNKSEGSKVKPFFHALFGIARQTTTTTTTSTNLGATSLERKQSNFAMAFGGGIDVKVHKRVDLRVFSVDYNPTYVKEQVFFPGTINEFALDGKLQNNVRFGFGIVIH